MSQEIEAARPPQPKAAGLARSRHAAASSAALRLRVTTHAIALGVTAILITVATIAFGEGSKPAIFLLDYHKGSIFPYPWTIQNLLHVMSAVGIAELYIRWHESRYQRRFLELGLLPEDDQTVLQLADLGAIRRRVVELKAPRAFLPQLVDLGILQLLLTKSLEQGASMIEKSVDLMSHRVDLSYQMTRYIAWLVPTTGFIGTVVGIAVSLQGVGAGGQIDLHKVAAGLEVAFYTTIVALLESAILVFIQNQVQRVEELSLNEAAEYCLRNLINRVYVAD